MEQVRGILSKGSSMEQLQSELTVLGKAERQLLLGKVIGRDSTVVIPAEDLLAMKADLSITWSKLRELRRYDLIMYMKHKNKHTLSRWMKEALLVSKSLRRSLHYRL